METKSQAPHSSASKTSQLYNRGGWGRGEKKARTIAAPTLFSLAGPCPTPIPGEGANLGREPPAQASSEGVWWSPEAGREGRSCFPFGPPPHPCPHLGPQGPSKQDGGGGREDRVRAQALALAQPGHLGEGALPQDAPPKPGGKPSGKQAGKPAEKAAVNTSS